jgi:hypothetical protein
MSSSVDGVILGMRSILEDPLRMAEIDFKAVPLPWREQLFQPNRKLKIGWLVFWNFIELYLIKFFMV